MKRILQLGLFGTLIGIIVYLLRNRQEPASLSTFQEPVPSSTTFYFDPKNVTRRVLIVVPAQERGLLNIDALPLEPEPTAEIPAAKGFKSVDVAVINPRITLQGSREPVTFFSPPLTITVYYADTDIAVAGGVENLKLVTYYRDERTNMWRWQDLGAKLDPERMTLTAELYTLVPKDPVGIGH